MEISFAFKPQKSFCGLPITTLSIAKITEHFGEPDEIETVENPLYKQDLTVYHFNKHKFTLFFNVNQLTSIAIANTGFKLFNALIFKLREKEIIQLFNDQEFSKFEIDTDWGEKQLVFEDAGVTVFFDNQWVSEMFIDV